MYGCGAGVPPLAPRGVPQLAQNLTPGAFWRPQLVQKLGTGAAAATGYADD